MSETSFAQQIMMSNWEMNSQIMQGAFSAISNISGLQSGKNTNSTNGIANLTVTNNFGKLSYAVEGDSKYKEEIDADDDGIITYNEYVKYITEERLSKYNLTKSQTTYSFGEDSQTGLLKFSVTNIGKVLSAYLNNYVELPTGKVEKEA